MCGFFHAFSKDILHHFNFCYFFSLGDKPFSCDICQKKFALSCNLRAHLKTHEAEYQNSATSLALYRRALAALGSPEHTNSSSPIHEEPESPGELIEEDAEVDDANDRSESSPSPNLPNNNSNSSMDINNSTAARMTAVSVL